MENSELLERFLPGYRIVCRIFARYLGIDLTDFMSKAFVLFALFKSVQYLYSLLSGLSSGFLTSSIEVPDGHVQRDVLAWVERKFRRGGGRKEVAVSQPIISNESKDENVPVPLPGVFLPIYEPAFDSTMYFFQKHHLIVLRRERRKPEAGGDTIILTCIGLTTQPLRDFLRECVITAARGFQEKVTREENEFSKLHEKKQMELCD
jgi:hypothetical protein